MTIRLITFDLDRTLWTADDVIHRAEFKAQEWLAERVPTYGSLTRCDREDIRAQVLKTHSDPAHDVTRLRIDCLSQALLICGKSDIQAKVLAKGAFAVFMEWRNKVELYEGALESLYALRHKYILASLTNGNANVQATPLKSCFKFSLSAADVGSAKPESAMFLAALCKTGTQPPDAVHVGDNPVDDIQGATNAGIKTVWVDFGIWGQQGIKASATVHCLTDLVPAITALDRGR